MSWRLMFCSRPSGIKDFPVELSSSISERSRVSSTPSARRSFKRRGGLFGEQAREDLAASSGNGKRGEVGRDFAIRVDDVAQQGVRGSAGDSRKVGADSMALTLVLVARLTILGEDIRTATRVARELEGGLIARQGLGALRRREPGQNLRGSLALLGIRKMLEHGCAPGRRARSGRSTLARGLRQATSASAGIADQASQQLAASAERPACSIRRELWRPGISRRAIATALAAPSWMSTGCVGCEQRGNDGLRHLRARRERAPRSR